MNNSWSPKMVVGQPREDQGQGHRGSIVMDDVTLRVEEGEDNTQLSSSDVVDLAVTNTILVSESPVHILAYSSIDSQSVESNLNGVCDSNAEMDTCDYDNCSCKESSITEECMETDGITSATSSEKSESLSSLSMSSLDNSDYTDSVSSADSSRYLLPPRQRKSDGADQRGIKTSIESKSGTLPDERTRNNECYNKEYRDTIFSNASSTRPLLKKTDSLWSMVRDVEVSTPVLGLIDHPGFMSSQRDLSSNSNLSFACQKALQFLQDERVASSLLLSGSKKDITIESLEDVRDPDDIIDHNIVPSGRHTRNLISLTACITMVFIACGSLRNLQTSINHEGGVGVTGLAANFMGYMIGSIFSPFIVQNFHPYRALIASLVPHVLYIAANFYPTMWIMVPVSMLWGVSGAILWNAMSTYITFLAKGYSEKKKADYEIILSRFFGIFYLVWQLYMIFGNLIASLVLTYVYPTIPAISGLANDNSTLNGTDFVAVQPEAMYNFSETVIMNSSTPNASSQEMMCGANYSHHYAINNTGTAVSVFAKYVLYGIYMGFMVVALIIAALLLEPLNSRLFTSAVMKCNVVKTQIVSLGCFVTNRKFLLLCPLLLFSQTQAAFANGEITKAFVSCPIGVHMVGYTMICMGVAGSGSAYLSGWLTRFLGRTVLIGTAVVFNLGLLAFMAVWQPRADSLVVIFVLFGLWGIADGIWMAQSNCLMGVLFPEKFEEAFTGLRVMQGLGPAIIFAFAQSLCMATKIYIMGAVCVLAMAGYLLSEHLLKKELKAKEVTVFEATEKV